MKINFILKINILLTFSILIQNINTSSYQLLKHIDYKPLTTDILSIDHMFMNNAKNISN
jgi:hypothetical protein